MLKEKKRKTDNRALNLGNDHYFFFHKTEKVALCYYNGKGVEKDIDKAKEYLEKACERGFAPACELLKKIS